jgi:hypothetical protein
LTVDATCRDGHRKLDNWRGSAATSPALLVLPLQAYQISLTNLNEFVLLELLKNSLQPSPGVVRLLSVIKGKAVPLHAMEALGGEEV